jgi:hypothetical protein
MNKSGLYLLAAITAIILILFAINVFPIPGTDSIVFIPPAFLYSKGHGLANPLYFITKITDPTHTNRFNYYVPFYPFLLGLLSKPHPGIKTIFFICSLFSTANIFLYTRYLSRQLTASTSKAVQVIALLSIPYVATYLLPTVGRPECITILMSFLIYLLYSKRNQYSVWFYNITLCILFALILATQLIGFYFCFLLFITAELLNNENVPRTIITNTLRFVAILLLFCLVLAISPNGLASTITGIRLHIGYVLDRTDRSVSLFLYYWLLAPLNVGFLLLFVLGAVFYVKRIMAVRKTLPAVRMALLLVVQLFLIYGIGKFILYASPTVYNATQFILPLSAFIIVNIASLKKGQVYGFRMTAVAAYAAGAIMFLRSLVLFIDYLNDGKTYDKAKIVANNIAREHPNVYISNGLWSLFDDPDHVKFFTNHVNKGDILIVQQAYHPFPPELEGKCTVIYDWTTTSPRKILGIPLSKRPQGYSFWVCRVN